MIKLSPAILQSVAKPARYMGGEMNSVQKDHAKMDCTIALSMPDVYDVGMSNLGLKILYEVVNRLPNAVAERVYTPWPDMEAKMKEHHIPLYALESKEPIRSFDFLGFSLQYELCYTNLLNMLHLADIPFYTKDRTLADPFVMAGGPCVYNVEPIADFIDFFMIGEAEELFPELVHAYVVWKQEMPNGRRESFLKRISQLDGIYVPSFYEPEYDAEGNFSCLKLLEESAPSQIKKRIIKDMNSIPTIEKPVIPYIEIVHDRLMLELFRGCSRGCRFCQAGITYRPVRERTEADLLTLAEKMIVATGYDEMSLTSLSSADYSCLAPLIDDLLEKYKGKKMSFSLPSLRIDSFSIDIAHKLQVMRKSGLTFAPEAGTQRLRDVINKGVTEEDLFKACSAAFSQGWKSVKLYFMMGLPTETDEDIIGIAKLGERVVKLYQEVTGRRDVSVTVSVSCFVPKPFTAFQWFPQNPKAEFERKQLLLKKSITNRAVKFHYHDASTSILEGIISRGDRRLAPVILKAYQEGAKFDGWSEFFQPDIWEKAFQECGIDPDYYNYRERTLAEALPWEHTTPGVSKNFLWREYEKALAEKLTKDCRRGACTGCGICPNLKAEIIDGRGEHLGNSFSLN